MGNGRLGPFNWVETSEARDGAASLRMRCKPPPHTPGETQLKTVPITFKKKTAQKKTHKYDKNVFCAFLILMDFQFLLFLKLKHHYVIFLLPFSPSHVRSSC